MALLSGCVSMEPGPAGFTTFHPSDRTTVYFVCEKYYHHDDVAHQHEHIKCDKDRLLNFKVSF